jgi:hypothetical protein
MEQESLSKLLLNTWYQLIAFPAISQYQIPEGLPNMTLITEDLGDALEVDAATLDEALLSEGFGKFAILSASAHEFIQAGNDWQPGEESSAFLQSHGSDPWALEYREGERQFRADGKVTLEQIRQAFHSYLVGGQEWRSKFAWSEIDEVPIPS